MQIQTIAQVALSLLLLGAIGGCAHALYERARGAWGWRSVTAWELESGLLDGLRLGAIVAVLWAMFAATFLTTWN